MVPIGRERVARLVLSDGMRDSSGEVWMGLAPLLLLAGSLFARSFLFLVLERGRKSGRGMNADARCCKWFIAGSTPGHRGGARRMGSTFGCCCRRQARQRGSVAGAGAGAGAEGAPVNFLCICPYLSSVTAAAGRIRIRICVRNRAGTLRLRLCMVAVMMRWW